MYNTCEMSLDSDPQIEITLDQRFVDDIKKEYNTIKIELTTDSFENDYKLFQK